MSMIEILVAMALMTIVAALAVITFTNIIESQDAVTSATQATTKGQVVTETINQAVRQAAAVKVTGGTRLDVRATDNTCRAWAVSGDTLRMTSSSTTISTSPSTWAELADGIDKISALDYFTAFGTGVTYNFAIEASNGSMNVTSSVVPRVPESGGTSCFS